jgi:GMP synthase (glutamine-hydrolysing)
MKKVLIIKTGTTHPLIKEKHGVFEDFIINQGEIQKDRVIVSAVYKNEALPDINSIDSIIITGSHSMVTDKEDWSVKLSEWINEISKYNIPTLGICYGHQLLCQAFGGIVGYHPKGIEKGTVNIELTEEGKKDKLLGILPSPFLGHVSHSQSVIKLPEKAILLAKNDFE